MNKIGGFLRIFAFCAICAVFAGPNIANATYSCSRDYTSCVAGRYLNGTSPNRTCESCPTGYSNSGGSGGRDTCKISCNANTHVASGGGGCTACAGGTYKASHDVFADNTSSCNACSTDFPGTAACETSSGGSVGGAAQNRCCCPADHDYSSNTCTSRCNTKCDVMSNNNECTQSTSTYNCPEITIGQYEIFKCMDASSNIGKFTGGNATNSTGCGDAGPSVCSGCTTGWRFDRCESGYTNTYSNGTSAGACVNTRPGVSCTIRNYGISVGTGTQTETFNGGSWSPGTCNLSTCSPGFEKSGNTCICPGAPKTTNTSLVFQVGEEWTVEFFTPNATTAEGCRASVLFMDSQGRNIGKRECMLELRNPPAGSDYMNLDKCITECYGDYEAAECGCEMAGGAACADYPGSLYQRLVLHAIDFCERPSETEYIDEFMISPKALQDVNEVMDGIRIQMASRLKAICEEPAGINGKWMEPKAKTNHNCNIGDDNKQNWVPACGVQSCADVGYEAYVKGFNSSDSKKIIAEAEAKAEKEENPNILTDAIQAVTNAANTALKDAGGDRTTEGKCTLFQKRAGANFKWGYCTSQFVGGI